MDTSTLLDARQAAKRLNISVAFFRKLVGSRRAPPPIPLGRARRWDQQVLESWIAAGCPALDEWERQAR